MNMLRISICVAGLLALAQNRACASPILLSRTRPHFTPQVSIVSTAAMLDATGHRLGRPHKYVTMTMRPSDFHLLALRLPFTFQNAQQNQANGNGR